MAKQEQLLRLKLNGNYLYVQRLNRDKERIGKRTKWEIRERSTLPRELFYQVRGFLQRSIKKFGTKSPDGLSRAGRVALLQAGRAFGCKIRNGSARADLYWSKGGVRLFAWQVHTEYLDERRVKELRGSKALLRLAVVLRGTGFFEIIPLRTKVQRS